ncbi:MAG: shikimate kinase [Muribaculaceae bacterium]|nr:shikimate kinase [Muribaculaceae bacterium]
MTKTVFLIGFPGCGKTTLGVELARQTGWPLTDLDDWIEQQQGMTIKQLYGEVGDARFRQIEHEALRTMAEQPGVVACGGGTPCQPGAMEWMNAHGLTVWLTTSTERLITRLCLPEHRAKRPQIATLTDEQIARYVHTKITERTPYYAQAKLQFDATEIETAQETVVTARRLAQLIEQNL